MLKNIELELRGEVLKKNFDAIFNKLQKRGKFISETNRLSVMFFSGSKNNCLDIRVRITNGESEVVIKKGDLHSYNRTEFSQKISIGQFIKTIKILSQLEFNSKVGERKTFNFKFQKNIIISLIKAGDLSYLEIEKMTNKLNQERDKKQLNNLANTLGIKIIKNKEKFNNFCKKLNDSVDWKFNGTEKEYKKLKSLLNKHKINL